MLPSLSSSPTDQGRSGTSHEPKSSGKNSLKVLANPIEPCIDIVAVHGLDPLGRESHAEATWTLGDSLWLRDFLPKRTPQARILLFDYNANVAFRSSTAGVLEQADSLINQLELCRTEQPHRPLIFICHSLGGIVVKRALISAKQDKLYKSIADSTFGVIFFGTPHKGGNNAKIGDVVAGIVRKLGGKPKNSFMSALRGDSWFANTITNDFRQFFEEMYFQSFYETRPLGAFGMVVDPQSAVLGLSESREKRIPLDADHSKICKFESDQDLVYQHVEDNIARMVEDALSSLAKPLGSLQTASEGNVAATRGQGNVTLQAGRANQCQTTGSENKCHQFGDGNNNGTSGNGNATTQLVLDPTEVEKYMQKFFQPESLIASKG